MTQWHVDQKVRCIRRGFCMPDPRHPEADLWETGCTVEPQFGVIYTIHRIFPWQGEFAFWLHELDDPFVSFHEEMFEPMEKVR